MLALELSLLLLSPSPPRNKRSCGFVRRFQNESLPLLFFFVCMCHLPFSTSDKKFYQDLRMDFSSLSSISRWRGHKKAQGSLGTLGSKVNPLR